MGGPGGSDPWVGGGPLKGGVPDRAPAGGKGGIAPPGGPFGGNGGGAEISQQKKQLGRTSNIPPKPGGGIPGTPMPGGGIPPLGGNGGAPPGGIGNPGPPGGKGGRAVDRQT